MIPLDNPIIITGQKKQPSQITVRSFSMGRLNHDCYHKPPRKKVCLWVRGNRRGQTIKKRYIGEGRVREGRFSPPMGCVAGPSCKRPNKNSTIFGVLNCIFGAAATHTTPHGTPCCYQKLPQTFFLFPQAKAP